MKKIYVLIPSLVALSNAPLITLAGCSKKNTELKFSVSTETTGQNTASIFLDWKPSGNSIIFTNWKAKSETNPISNVDPGSESRPRQIKLTFSQKLSDDLNDVVIEFNYYDGTSKREGHKKIDGICIDKYNSSSIEWDFVKNGFYEPTEIKVDPRATTQDDSFKNYLADIENKPEIFIEDILNTENYEYFSLKYIFQAKVDTYTVTYKVEDIEKDKGTLKLTINRDIFYTLYDNEEIEIKTDLTLSGFPYVGRYILKNLEGKAQHCWSFVPIYYGYGVDEFRQLMSNLEDDWEIGGTIDLYSKTPDANSEYKQKLEYDWNKSNIGTVEIPNEYIEFLNQEYYGVENSYYYINCPIECDDKFQFYEGKYAIRLVKSVYKSQYLGCGFDDEPFEGGDYSIQVIDLSSKTPIPNLDMKCSLDGNYKSLHTNSEGKAQLGEIQKESNLILHLSTWPASHDEIEILIVKNTESK